MGILDSADMDISESGLLHGHVCVGDKEVMRGKGVTGSLRWGGTLVVKREAGKRRLVDREEVKTI